MLISLINSVRNRRAVAILLTSLMFVFQITILYPDLVWCHKADGSVVLEITFGYSYECHCDSCELLSEASTASEKPVIKNAYAAEETLRPFHCFHSPVSFNLNEEYIVSQKEKSPARNIITSVDLSCDLFFLDIFIQEKFYPLKIFPLKLPGPHEAALVLRL